MGYIKLHKNEVCKFARYSLLNFTSKIKNIHHIMER
nr:MAG TPA: hypothetical protein [Caudoviricetes sp.]